MIWADSWTTTLPAATQGPLEKAKKHVGRGEMLITSRVLSAYSIYCVYL